MQCFQAEPRDCCEQRKAAVLAGLARGPQQHSSMNVVPEKFVAYTELSVVLCSASCVSCRTTHGDYWLAISVRSSLSLRSPVQFRCGVLQRYVPRYTIMGLSLNICNDYAPGGNVPETVQILCQSNVQQYNQSAGVVSPSLALETASQGIVWTLRICS